MSAFTVDPAPPDTHLCEIIQNEKLTDTIYSITVSAQYLASNAHAGQFISVLCGTSRILRRPISIASAVHGLLRFVFETRGAGTDWLAHRKPGDILDILGPLGKPFSFPDGNIIVVGGGIGVPPMLNAAKKSKNAAAVLGFRSKSFVILENEFNEICGEVYVTTDNGSYGTAGFVTSPLETLLKRGGFSAVLACGPREMLKAVAALCKTYDILCEVSLEERMACGVGACLVCACRTIKNGEEFSERVCKDGPVFNAREVIW